MPYNKAALELGAKHTHNVHGSTRAPTFLISKNGYSLTWLAEGDEAAPRSYALHNGAVFGFKLGEFRRISCDLLVKGVYCMP